MVARGVGVAWTLGFAVTRGAEAMCGVVTRGTEIERVDVTRGTVTVRLDEDERLDDRRGDDRFEEKIVEVRLVDARDDVETRGVTVTLGVVERDA